MLDRVWPQVQFPLTRVSSDLCRLPPAFLFKIGPPLSGCLFYEWLAPPGQLTRADIRALVPCVCIPDLDGPIDRRGTHAAFLIESAQSKIGLAILGFYHY